MLCSNDPLELIDACHGRHCIPLVGHFRQLFIILEMVQVTSLYRGLGIYHVQQLL